MAPYKLSIAASIRYTRTRGTLRDMVWQGRPGKVRIRDGSTARGGWSPTVLRLFRKFFDTTDKEIRRLSEKVAQINQLEPRMERLTDEELRGADGPVQEAAGRRGDAGRPAARGLCRRAGGGKAHHRPAALRRAAHGRHRAARRAHRRDEDGRREDAGGHAARLPQRAGRAGASTWSRSTTTWPSATPSGWGPSTASSACRWASSSTGKDFAERRARIRLRRHLRHQQRVRLRLPAGQHGAASRDQMVQRELYYAIVDEVDSILIDEARTPLIISGQAEQSTDHLLPVRPAGASAEAGRGLHRRRKGPHRGA